MTEIQHDTVRTERLDDELATEINQHIDRIDDERLRRVVFSAIRWPAIGCGSILIIAIIIAGLVANAHVARVDAMSVDLAAQKVQVEESRKDVAAVAAMRDADAEKFRKEINAVLWQVSHATDQMAQSSKATDRIEGKLVELSERMDRVTADLTREADARRDLIKAMQTLGDRMQRQ